MLRKRFCLTLALLLIGVMGFSQNIPERPVPPRLVNDYAGILSADEVSALETKLVNYNDTTSTQICVVTVTSLDGTTSNDFAQKLGQKWGVGTKDNNGAVILVLPKIGNESGDCTIQVGYGLEPYVTDADCHHIIYYLMIPKFKENDYYSGINEACDEIIGLASGEFMSRKEFDDAFTKWFVRVMLLAIAYVILKRLRRAKKRSIGQSFWWAFFLGDTYSGGSHGGSGRRSGGSYGGSGGYGGGSSFGGFGGGSFGGGGASGKW